MSKIEELEKMHSRPRVVELLLRQSTTRSLEPREAGYIGAYIQFLDARITEEMTLRTESDYFKAQTVPEE